MHREGVAYPATGVVYMTEDRADSCFYRHVPDRKDQPCTGKVQEWLCGQHHGPYPAENVQAVGEGKWKPGTEFKVEWRDIPDPQASNETCRTQGKALGCTQFNRNEGIIWDKDSVWFISSLGGPTKGGQIFQYIPSREDDSKGTLVLQLEVTDRRVLSCPDNLVMAPWGDDHGRGQLPGGRWRSLSVYSRHDP